VTSATSPTHLRIEHHDGDVLGTDVRVPRFSWWLPQGAAVQHAYRLRGGSWDSGWVEGDDNVLVPYDGPPLTSRQRLACRVRTRTDLGESRWSAPVDLEIGLVEEGDWTASWITPTEPVDGEPGQRPAVLLERTFTAAPEAEVGRIYATAHGVYELFLNGDRIGDIELTPGFTSYGSRLQYQTFDVTGLVRPGENNLRALVSDGWFRGRLGFTREHDVFGPELALLLQLELDGELVVGTDTNWRAAASGTAADLIEGQRTDLTLGPDLAWGTVDLRDHGVANLVASPAPPMRRVESIRARSVTELADGRHVVDLGQNINGWLRITDLGPRGTELRLTHGELLDDDGDVTVEHLRPTHFRTGEKMSAGQVDTVVSDGSTEWFEPRHTTHGFQYARIEGHPGPLSEDHVLGVVVHTDLRRTGWFRCSDDRLNRLHEAAVWSFRTNACDIPTDCPQRERAGWTGDWQIFSPAASFLFDVGGFSTKWLRDLAADQRADGAVRNFAPDVATPGAKEHPIKTFLEASAGWGDAAVLVPWDVHRFTGDHRVLEEQYGSMTAWVEFQAHAARSARHPSRIERSTEPLPHEEFLWDSGFHWGEWCEPGGDDSSHFDNLDRDFAIIATAYFARSAKLLSHIASMLGHDDDAARYARYAERATRAWREEFLGADGSVKTTRQADTVRALAFELAPPEHHARVAAQLVEQVRAAGTHLNTGFLATPFLLPVLADHGHADVAYEVLLQRTNPAWLHMIDRGATTIWESWEGFDMSGVGSLNHYSKGAVVSFLHGYVAGIRPIDASPAYKRFRIAPVPGGGITWAEASLDSPHGRIGSTWRIVDAHLDLKVRVPPGTSAEVALPDGRTAAIGPGTARFRCPHPPARP
jgi:alpha-L-rhamnosidase